MFITSILTILQAKRQNLTYPGYVWITQGWYSDQWWMEEDTNCTREEMKSFLERAIAISHFPTASSENDITDSGIVSISCMHITYMYVYHSMLSFTQSSTILSTWPIQIGIFAKVKMLLCQPSASSDCAGVCRWLQGTLRPESCARLCLLCL